MALETFILQVELNDKGLAGLDRVRSLLLSSTPDPSGDAVAWDRPSVLAAILSLTCESLVDSNVAIVRGTAWAIAVRRDRSREHGAG